MGDMGLGLAFGAGGAADAYDQIRKRIADAKQQEFNNTITQQEQARADRIAQQNDELRKAQLQSIQDQRDQSAAKNVESTLEPNDSILPAQKAILQKTLRGGLIKSNPAAAGGQFADASMPTDFVPGQQPGDIYRGTPAQRTDQEQKILRGQLISDPGLRPDQQFALRAENAGLKVPPGFEVRPTNVGDANYMLNGKPIVAQKTSQGRLMYQGQDVTDRVAPYTPPVQPVVVMTGTGPQVVDRRAGTAKPVLGDDGNPIAPKQNAQLERQAKLAEFAGEDIDAAQSAVDAAEQGGLLGPTNGRIVGQFLGGFVGSTGDKELDQKLGHLRGAIATMKQSYPPAISGSVRGGGGMDRLAGVLNTDKFSADALRGALNEMKGATTRRAPKSESGGGSAGVPDAVKAALKGIAPGRHTLSDGSVWDTDASGGITKVK